MSIVLTQTATRVRKTSPAAYSDGQEASMAITQRGSILVTQDLPIQTELARLDCGWQVQNTSALASLVVRPSTVAGLTLYNGEGAGGKHYVIDYASAFNLVSTDAIGAWSIWGCLHPAGMTAPTADITAIKSYSAKSAYGGAAIVDTGATVVDNGWFILSNSGNTIGNPGGVTPGTALNFPLNGKFIIPPTGGFSIQVVSSLVGYTFTHGIGWYELQLQ
jgi:hypothetical protein